MHDGSSAFKGCGKHPGHATSVTLEMPGVAQDEHQKHRPSHVAAVWHSLHLLGDLSGSKSVSPDAEHEGPFAWRRHVGCQEVQVTSRVQRRPKETRAHPFHDGLFKLRVKTPYCKPIRVETASQQAPTGLSHLEDLESKHERRISSSCFHAHVSVLTSLSLFSKQYQHTRILTCL